MAISDRLSSTINLFMCDLRLYSDWLPFVNRRFEQEMCGDSVLTCGKESHHKRLSFPRDCKRLR